MLRVTVHSLFCHSQVCLVETFRLFKDYTCKVFTKNPVVKKWDFSAYLLKNYEALWRSRRYCCMLPSKGEEVLWSVIVLILLLFSSWKHCATGGHTNRRNCYESIVNSYGKLCPHVCTFWFTSCRWLINITETAFNTNHALRGSLLQPLVLSTGDQRSIAGVVR